VDLKLVFAVVQEFHPWLIWKPYWGRDMVIQVAEWPPWLKRPWETSLDVFRYRFIKDRSYIWYFILCEHLVDQIIHSSNAAGWVYHMPDHSLNGNSNSKELFQYQRKLLFSSSLQSQMSMPNLLPTTFWTKLYITLNPPATRSAGHRNLTSPTDPC